MRCSLQQLSPLARQPVLFLKSFSSALIDARHNLRTQAFATTPRRQLSEYTTAAMGSDDSKSPEHSHIEKLVEKKMPGSPIYAFLLSSIRITSATKGHVIARLPLGENQMNSNGSLHGAVSAAIVDWAGGMAISSFDLREKSGVNVDIHVTYQSGAKLGEELEIEGLAERVGGSLAFTKINIYKVEGDQRGKVVATGTHTKYVKGSEPQKAG